MPTRRVITAALASLAAILLVVGPALAWFSSHGAAAGASSSANGLGSFTTTATVPTGSLLYPGGSAAPLTVNVNNTANGYALLVTSLALDSSRSIGVDAAHAAGCTAPALTVVTPAGWAGIAVPAHASSGATTIASAVSMGLGASSGCQGATFTIPLTMSGRNT